MSTCPFPISIRDPSTGRFNAVPCGKCHVCKKNRREEWTIRLLEESKNHQFTYFLTLTYSEEESIYVNYEQTTLYKPHLQRFFKRIRKIYKIRYYAVGEYGTKTFRAHYHALIFSDTAIPDIFFKQKWTHGHCHVSIANLRRVVYTTKYHVNRTKYPPDVEPPFALMSQKPGIGYCYVEKMRDYHAGEVTRSHYTMFEFKKRLPRYFKDKLYTKVEKAKIAEISFKLSNDIKEIEKYLKKYPKSNFFKVRHQQLMHAENTYREKVNFNNTF